MQPFFYGEFADLTTDGHGLQTRFRRQYNCKTHCKINAGWSFFEKIIFGVTGPVHPAV
jgi:hypothetical protein